VDVELSAMFEISNKSSENGNQMNHNNKWKHHCGMMMIPNRTEQCRKQKVKKKVK